VAAVGNGLDVRRPAVEAMTLAELIGKWHAEKAGNVRHRDELKTKALHYLGPLAHRRAAEVTREDIGTVHSRIAHRGPEAHPEARGRRGAVGRDRSGRLPATADKWRATINAVYTWGMKKGLVVDTRAAGIDAAFDAKGAQRTNYLRGDELLRFWKALEADHDVDTRDALLLLLYTGQRRGNVLAMRWSAIDLEHGIWTLGAADTKQRAAQSTPLTAHAQTILQRRHADAASDFVFPAHALPGSRTACNAS